MTNRPNVNLVIGFIGLVVLLCIGIAGWLAMTDKGIPDLFVITIGTGMGALGSIFVNTSDGKVTVDNPPSDPVNVAETN